MAGVPSRKSVAGASSMRASVAAPGAEEYRKRQGRNVRDKAHQYNCINTVASFLASNDYDKPISASVLAGPPSLKEFQQIFRFLCGFIDPSAEFGKKFEDDVLLFIRGIRYPFASEINKSQLIAITPHTWPVLLSMLAWLAEVVVAIDRSDAHVADAGECNRIFNEYVYKSYSSFMENRDDGEAVEMELESAMDDLNRERSEIVSENKRQLAAIQAEVSRIEDDQELIASLEERREQIGADMSKLVGFRKLQEGKMKKYTRLVDEVKRAMEEVCSEIRAAAGEKERLEGEVGAQKIRPEDVEEMHNERDALVKGLDAIKMERGGLMREVQALEKKMSEAVEEIEKLLFDLSNIKGGFQIDVGLRRGRGEGIFYQSEDCDFYGSLEKEYEEISAFCSKVSAEIGRAEHQLQDLHEQHSALSETQSALRAEIKSREERMKMHAQMYVEKKEACDEEQRRGTSRLERIESDLLKLTMDSRDTLFQSEQGLERLKIQKGRMFNRIASERAEIEKIGFLLHANLTNCKSKCSSIIAECFDHMS